jgi:hypothetical protein
MLECFKVCLSDIPNVAKRRQRCWWNFLDVPCHQVPDVERRLIQVCSGVKLGDWTIDHGGINGREAEAWLLGFYKVPRSQFCELLGSASMFNQYLTR